jgi:excisionase family DNA binding protein
VEPLAVDVREASRLTSLSSRSIRRYIKTGRIRAVRVGHRLLVPMASLHELLSLESAEGEVAGSTSRADESPSART